MTLQNFYNEFFELTVPIQSEKTVSTKRAFFKNRILPALGEIEMNEIKYKHIQEFVNALLLELKPKTVKNIISGLSTLYRYAQKHEIVDSNPCVFAELPQFDNKRDFEYSKEVQVEFVKSALTYREPMMRDIFLFLFHGRRKGEVLNLTWDMVDFDQRLYRIPAMINKARKNMSYKMTDILYDRLMFHYLHECINQNTRFPRGYVFVNPETRTKYSYLKKAWDRFLEANDLPKIRLHDIRHLIGTYSINILELPIEKISHTLGHTNVATTEKYVTIKPETSKQVIDKIFASVESV